MENKTHDDTQLISYFNQRAPSYERNAEWVKSNYIYLHHMYIFPQLNQGKLLDIATGTGVLLDWFSKNAELSVGVDISDDMLNEAKEKCNNLVWGNACFMPLKNDSFDIVTCRQGLHYMELNKVIPEIARVSKKYILISQIICASEIDTEWWKQIFFIRQPLRKNIFTRSRLIKTFNSFGFKKKKEKVFFEEVKLRNWFQYGGVGKNEYKKVKKIFLEADNYQKKVNKINIRNQDIFYSNRWIVMLFSK